MGATQAFVAATIGSFPMDPIYATYYNMCIIYIRCRIPAIKPPQCNTLALHNMHRLFIPATLHTCSGGICLVCATLLADGRYIQTSIKLGWGSLSSGTAGLTSPAVGFCMVVANHVPTWVLACMCNPSNFMGQPTLH